MKTDIWHLRIRKTWNPICDKMYLGAGQLTEKEHKEHKYTDMGYSFTDKKNNFYYSLFGNKIPTEEKNGKYGLNYLLYKHIDNLLIRRYS